MRWNKTHNENCLGGVGARPPAYAVTPAGRQSLRKCYEIAASAITRAHGKGLLAMTVGVFLFLVSCEIPTEEYSNPLDLEYAEEQGIETPALIFNPSELNVNVGSSVSVQVYAMEVDDMAGAHVQVSYDKNKLSLNSVSIGTFFDGTRDPIFITDNNASTGTIDIYTSFLDSVSVSGTGNLAYLVFSATSPGESMLQYTSECELVDPDDNSIEIKGFGVGVVDAQ